MTEYDLGIDTGGTFTDCILFNVERNELTVLKTLSTPRAPGAAVLLALSELLSKHGRTGGVRFFVHGSTVPTNTIIERTGDAVGVITTRGFRDILFIRRVALPDPSYIFGPRPDSLVKRRHVFEVTERILADGSIDTPLNLDDVVAAARACVSDGITSIVVSFLHSYRNPVHEERAKSCILDMYPNTYVTTSSEIWPRFREYERTLVAVMDCYIGHKVRNYLREVRDGYAGKRNAGPFLVAKGNGGVMTVESAITHPVHSLHSGPAAGAIAAQHVARTAGFDRIVAWDMGGTSSDVTVIDRELPRTDESHAGEFSIYLPTVDINSIGAGGGSIITADASGLLRIGPESAGAEPGPACYGRGGKRATMTDAYVALGMIPPIPIAGGKLRIQKSLADEALATVAPSANMSGSAQVADAAVRVATSKMYAQILPLMAKYGVDAKDFTLVAYGGAGPTHAFLIAKEVGFRRVMIPLLPGLLCAWGCLIADLLMDFPETVHLPLSEQNRTKLVEILQQLEIKAMNWIQTQRIDVIGIRLERLGNLRYRGQAFELEVPLPPEITPESLENIAESFHQVHRRRYGFSDKKAQIDIIDVSVRARGERTKPELRAGLESTVNEARDQMKLKFHQVFYEGKEYQAKEVCRTTLQVGERLEGPLTIVQSDTTVFIPPGFAAEVDPHLNIIGELP